jgi:hypothetical protein
MMKFKLSLVATILVLLSGCGGTLKTYPGGMLSQNESGVLTCEPYLGISAIDGDTSMTAASGGGLWFRDCIISLKPGKHSVTFRYYTGGTVSFSTGYVTREFTVEKGKIYRIKYELEGTRWRPWIEQLKGEELDKQRKRISAELNG